MSFWPEWQAPGQGIVGQRQVVIGCLSRECVFIAPDLDVAETEGTACSHVARSSDQGGH